MDVWKGGHYQPLHHDAYLLSNINFPEFYVHKDEAWIRNLHLLGNGITDLKGSDCC